MSPSTRILPGLALLLVCLLAITACGEALITPTTTPTVDASLGPVVILTGKLVKDDLSTVNGAFLMAAASNASGQGIVLGENGIPINPEAQIDSTGRFRLVVPKSFLTQVGFKIKLVLIPASGYPAELVDTKGQPLVITIGRSLDKIDLGNIPIQ